MDQISHRKPYPSDLTDAQWELLAPFISEASPNATIEVIPRREIVNGILYVLRTGCSWRQMPHDLPAGKTVYHYFRRWKLTGVWEEAMNTLRGQARRAINREEEPSAAIIDSQSIKTSPVRGIERGFDAGKKIWGRKRHILVDTQGFLLAVKVHTASLVDRRGAPLLLEHLNHRFSRMRHVFADHGYTGPLLAWIKEHLGWETEIVPHEHNTSHIQWVLVDGQPVKIIKSKGGFQVQRKRWIVENTQSQNP
ncbi:IS5 family transposase [Dictyobacter formicarum]|uniref:IS5 family transposase n=1 Tax=Dictyobacter formicarum TaxID=2778368 RepID=A0ABQ3V9Y6_9CHLR|nr:IS5 family transposase [Dictyobacter formicarum]GHO82316.1 IS5 family transposase [Dictyobacter formicarum]